MKLQFKELLIYFVSILSLILFLYLAINYLIKAPPKIINFIDSDINQDFEIEITKNIENINNYLNKYLFIESHILKRKNNEIYIQVKLKNSFAINYLTKEVIFYDNTTAPFNYFKQNFLDKIKLIDISRKSIYINNYLKEYYQPLSNLFDIEKIEYIDDRRYNLVISNSRVIMLPKVIDTKLLYFLKNNIDLINKSTNYRDFLDLRNFHNKTIRLK